MEESSSSSSPERRSGCGILSAVFGRRSWPRRTTSTGSIPSPNVKPPANVPISKRRRGGGDEGSFLDDEEKCNSVNQNQNQKKQSDRIVERPAPNSRANVHLPRQQNPAARRNPETVQGYAGKVAVGISGELERMIADHHRSKGGSNTLVRASSSNVMLYGNLGNLRQGGGGGANASAASVFAANEQERSVRGNDVVRKAEGKPVSLCRAISTRMDPEQLKILGNEDYKNGRFAEALALYDAAISIDANKASYRSNKSAALTALGRLLEAVFECREAIRIDPTYQRAHNRLATLYLRLGEAENAIYHYKQAGPEADPEVMTKARKLQSLLRKCTEAKMQRDWSSLLRETALTISACADSAPQIFALKAEALLKLQRHHDADETLKNGPHFEEDEITKFLGPVGHSIILVTLSQVDMSAGRFEEAAAAAQLAARLDTNNKEANNLVKKTRAVSSARSNGNELFKLGRHSEACDAYGEGLKHDPYNSVLLCNRAACRSKLGHHQKALEDCNAALNVRPCYTKARLRRSDCYLKLQRWEACIEDCEMLIKDRGGDEEVEKMMKEAQAQLRKQQRRDIVVVSSDQHFRHYTSSSSSGVAVVLFCNKAEEKSANQFLEQLLRKYRSVNFLKVEVEDQPSLARSEGVSSLPAYKVYTNGSRTKEISGNNHELLESTIRMQL